MIRSLVVLWNLAGVDPAVKDFVEVCVPSEAGLRRRHPPVVLAHFPVQYAPAQITAFAAANGISRSMGLTGICWDNAISGSFFAALKTEFYYRRIWPTRARAIREVGAWIENRPNRRRRHSSIGDVSPVDLELQQSSQASEDQLAA